MSSRLRLPAVTVTVLLIGVLLHTPVLAATATASATATVISPAEVSAAVAAAQMLFSGSVGVLTLRIPGSGGGGPGTTLELTASGTITPDGAMVFSATDTGGLAQLIERLDISGGSFSTNGVLSGKGVQIVVVQATQDSGGGGRVTAIVTYN